MGWMPWGSPYGSWANLLNKRSKGICSTSGEKIVSSSTAQQGARFILLSFGGG